MPPLGLLPGVHWKDRCGEVAGGGQLFHLQTSCPASVARRLPVCELLWKSHQRDRKVPEAPWSFGGRDVRKGTVVHPYTMDYVIVHDPS